MIPIVHLSHPDLRRSPVAVHTFTAETREMPTIAFLGHAGLRLEAAHFTLLADPWFSRSGAFLGVLTGRGAARAMRSGRRQGRRPRRS